MADQRAEAFRARSIKNESKASGLRLALSMLDLTTLEGKDTPGRVRALCAKAVRPMPDDERVLGERLPSVAAVCVYPSMVGVAREAIERMWDDPSSMGRSRVRVAAVATGFPSGQYPLDVRLRDVREAVRDGADEIDMVINRGAFLAGRYKDVGDEIRAVVEACGTAHLKVILETGELETYDNVRRASDLAIEHIRDGDFIKTSTGKIVPAATMGVSLVMLEAIRDAALVRGGPDGRRARAGVDVGARADPVFAGAGVGKIIGMKPAGGIRDAKTALHYLVMVKETLGDRWLTPDLFRFGASSLANDILRQIVRLKTGVYPAGHDFTDG